MDMWYIDYPNLFKAMRCIPFAVLTIWATMKLLFGWFSFDIYYVETGVIENLLAMWILWNVGKYLYPAKGSRKADEL